MNNAGAEQRPFLFILDFEQTEGIIIPNPLEQREVLFSIETVSNSIEPSNFDESILIEKHPITLEEYSESFNIIKEGMEKGTSVLANLTVRTPIEINKTLLEIYNLTDAKYKVYVPEASFVCFSPERFVAISEEGRISTDPMKGTISSDVPGAPEVILNDYKETSEHCSVVDLLRNDLSKVAQNVQVDRFRYFTEITTPCKQIYQVSSEISGQLPEKWNSQIGTIISQLLPAGSILGAPRESTRELIDRAESKQSRGYYCGIFGYYDGKSLDSSVLIRFICEDESGQKFYHSGGGVTINSTLEDEYNELLEKIYLPLRSK